MKRTTVVLFFLSIFPIQVFAVSQSPSYRLYNGTVNPLGVVGESAGYQLSGGGAPIGQDAQSASYRMEQGVVPVGTPDQEGGGGGSPGGGGGGGGFSRDTVAPSLVSFETPVIGTRMFRIRAVFSEVVALAVTVRDASGVVIVQTAESESFLFSHDISFLGLSPMTAYDVFLAVRDRDRNTVSVGPFRVVTAPIFDIGAQPPNADETASPPPFVLPADDAPVVQPLHPAAPPALPSATSTPVAQQDRISSTTPLYGMMRLYTVIRQVPVSDDGMIATTTQQVAVIDNSRRTGMPDYTDWTAIGGSEAVLSFPAGLFQKPVASIMTAIGDTTAAAAFNSMTQAYEAVLFIPEEPGRYAMMTRVVYVDNTYEDILQSVRADSYGIVSERNLDPFSGKAPWHLFHQAFHPVAGAVVELQIQTDNGAWMRWSASAYDQPNPQLSSESGTYAFLAPPGRYRLAVSKEGYESVLTDMFDTDGGIINTPISLRAIVERQRFLMRIFASIFFFGIVASGVFFARRRLLA